jgi:hypothetical protein
MFLAKIIRSPKTSYNLLAVGLGYLFWNICYIYVPLTKTVCAAVCFYNNDPDEQIRAPESIDIVIRGPHYLIQRTIPVVHIDAQQFCHNKKVWYTITPYNIFLPYAVSMLYCFPATIPVVKIKKTD